MRLDEIEKSEQQLLSDYDNDIKFAAQKYQSTESIIYRGTAVVSKKIFEVPEMTTRRSPTSMNNYHNLWMEGSPEWKSYPNRFFSAMCASNRATANEYGRPRVIIPIHTNCKIGVCPEGDLWDSFDGSAKKYNFKIPEIPRIPPQGIIAFNQRLYMTLVKTHAILSGEILKTYDELRTAILKVDDPEYIKHAFNSDKRLIDIVNEVYDPNRSNFILTTWKDYDIPVSSNRELWFRGPYISIKMEVFETYLK